MKAFFALVILIVGVVFVLRLLLGDRIMDAVIAKWIFEISRAIFTLPFKIIGFIIRLFR